MKHSLFIERSTNMKKILVQQKTKESVILDKLLTQGFGLYRQPTETILNNKNIKSYLFKENNKNIGIISVCNTPKLSYLMYIVVDKKLRNKGYGSRLLKEYEILSKNKIRIFETKLIDNWHSNKIEKERTRNFYIKRGYKQTGYGIIYSGTDNYEYYSNKRINIRDLKEILNYSNYKLFNPELVSIDKKLFHVKHLIKPHKIGVIFDYNGTLYDDNAANDTCWLKIINKYSKNKIKDINDILKICSHPKNRIFVKGFMKYFGYGDITNDEAEIISIDKENTYYKYLIEHKMKKLAEGTKELIEYFRKNHIPYSIATMAPEMNLKFYYKYNDIKKYFNTNLVICDSDKYNNKKQMYLDAAKLMNVDIKNCVVIEDSVGPIAEAIESGVKKIIYKNSRNKECNRKEIIQEVKSFKDINLNLIK